MSIFSEKNAKNIFPKVLISNILIENENFVTTNKTDPHINYEGEQAVPQPTNNQASFTISLKAVSKKQNRTNLSEIFRDSLKVAMILYSPEDPASKQPFDYDDLIRATIEGVNPPFVIQKVEYSLNNESYQETEFKEGQETFVYKIFNKKQSFNSPPKNLYIIYCSYFEVPAKYATRYGIEQNKIFSPIRIEAVIEDNKVKSESSIFFIEESTTGEIWDGLINLDPQDNTYITDESIPRKLVRFLVPNYKIQDFRAKTETEKIQLQFQKENNDLVAAQSKSYVNNGIKREKYFSEVMLSQKQNVSISFGFNYENLLLDNCLLANNPLLPDQLKAAILSESRITNFKIFRRRVQKSNKNTSNITDEIHSFQPILQYPEEILVNGIEDSNVVSFNQQQRHLVDAKEFTFFDASLNRKSKFFNIIDKTLKQQKQGLFQYGVEVEVSDGSIPLIAGDIHALRKDIKILKEYYSELELYLLGTIKQVVQVLNIEAVVQNYINIFSRYYDLNGTQQERNELKDLFLSQITPSSKTLKGLENFINLVEQLSSNLIRMVSREISFFDDPYLDSDYENSVRFTNRIFSVKHYFKNNVVDANPEKYKNVDFFGQPVNASYFNEFQLSEFEKRIIKVQGAITVIDPSSISYGQAIKTKERTIYEYDKERQVNEYNLKIRQNLLNYENVNIIKYDKTVDNEPGTKDYNSSSFADGTNILYENFSLDLSKIKTIDEVFDLYNFQESDIFQSEIYFLNVDMQNSGSFHWKNLPYLNTIREINPNSFIVCKAEPRNGYDYRNRKNILSEDFLIKDPFFLLSVQDNNSLNTFYNNIFRRSLNSNPAPPPQPSRSTQTEQSNKELPRTEVFDDNGQRVSTVIDQSDFSSGDKRNGATTPSQFAQKLGAAGSDLSEKTVNSIR